ncbi:hypothetical protein ACLF3G_25870 [Falsiroseomonas sp. HC035]|uniref:hypothetical protein n=1 Tax=Falsiroseomonas sp. HC035 TaxID=3390999 RepID=UPI003D3193B2
MVDETNLGSPAKHLKPGSRPVWWRTRAGSAVIGFALIAAFYVLRNIQGTRSERFPISSSSPAR